MAIASGESFFSSRARIITGVAEEVGHYRIVTVIRSHQVGVSDRALRKWLKMFEEQEVMVASRRGQHAKTISPIADPTFRAQFISQVRSESCKKGIFPKHIFLRNYEMMQ